MARFVVAERTTLRGAGLANELIPWAKGFIASQVLNARLVGPAWGLNSRRYWRNFNTSRLDVIAEGLLRLLPHEAFTEEEYYATGIIDYGEAIRAWATRKGFFRRRHFIVTLGGMYGGYLAISSARDFLRSRLLSSRNALPNMFKILSNVDRKKLLVALHMRLGGDFTATEVGADIRTRFNVQVPVCWYREVCDGLRREFPNQIQFRFFTDKETPEYLKTVSEYSPDQVRCRELSECSDLLLMASADLRICSVSSYSMAACFLSEGPYIWYEPQLHMENGIYSLWGHELRQQELGSPTAISADYLKTAARNSDLRFRGYPVGLNGILPQPLIERLYTALADKDPRTDLVQYGCSTLAP
jgi:hypothetical protein